jgi:F-type H+-transporting ATPase subunit b
MDETLHALAGILLRALPTFFLVFLLSVYLRHIFFRPLERVLQERYEAGGGARKLAEESMLRAAARSAEYDAAVRAARVGIYQAQERAFQELEEKRAGELAGARERAAALAREAKAQLAAEAETAKARMAGDVGSLAAQIADSILRRSAA